MLVILAAASPCLAGGGATAPLVAVVDGKEVPAPALRMGDDLTVQRILDEGKNRNQVMQHLDYLTHTIGPRLTGSTRALTANNWAKDQYAIWGLENVHLEQWGTLPMGFDRGPCSGKVFLRKETKERDRDGKETDKAKVEYDELRTLEFTTPSWTRGTDGPVRARVVKEPQTEEEFEAKKDTYAGAWVLLKARSPLAIRGIRSEVSPRIRMREDAHRKAEGKEPLYAPKREAAAKPEDGKDKDAPSTPSPAEPKPLTLPEKLALAGAAGFISASVDERVWTGAYTEWEKLTPETLPRDVEVIVRRSDYDFLNSRVCDGEPVEVEFDLKHRAFTQEGGVPVYNTIAEIPGTVWPEQVVIISAHIDSWDGPGSQGCTDNGTGTVVTLEAARILAAVNAHPKRTIRFINWTGEEQGLRGSHAYCEMHKAEMPNISAVFVDDGGTNSEGGLHCIASMAEMLEAATAPVNNQFYDAVSGKPLNVNIHVEEKFQQTGGSDHASFNAVGVPGFYWDEVGRAEYTFGWHTQNDKFELAIPEYLKQSATCAAVTAYRMACADSLLPRAPKEEKTDAPRGNRQGQGGGRRGNGDANQPKPEPAAAPGGKN